MDMRQIRHFVAAVDHGNILRAAAAIHISQPSLTKSIQNLESELGVKLLDRGPRGVTPTIYGASLLTHARLLLNGSEHALAEIRAIQHGRLGHLRLGVANFAIHFLPAVVARLISSKPGLSFEIVDGDYETLAELVRNGTLDAMISGLPPVRRAADLVHEELISTEFVVAYCPCRHLRTAGDRPTSLQALQDAQWILPNRPRAIIDLWELACRSQGVTPPRTVLQSGSYMFVKALLFEGPFVTILPRGVVHREIADGTLAAIAIEDPVGRTKEGVIYLPGAVQPPALSVLIAEIRSEYQRLLIAEGAASAPGSAVKAREAPSRASKKLGAAHAEEKGAAPKPRRTR